MCLFAFFANLETQKHFSDSEELPATLLLEVAKWPADGQPSSVRLPILGGSLQGLQGQGGASLERIVVSTCCLWAVAAVHKSIANVPLLQPVVRKGWAVWDGTGC